MEEDEDGGGVTIDVVQHSVSNDNVLGLVAGRAVAARSGEGKSPIGNSTTKVLRGEVRVCENV